MDPSEPKNPFRNLMGKLYTRGLFIETTEDLNSPIYTLRDRDYKGYPSLYLCYITEGDATEYRFATKFLEGWEHWQELNKAGWFQEYLNRWRYELDVKLRSEALANIIAVARNTDHNSSFQANKYLLDGSWKPASASKRGRPSNDEVKQEIRRQAASLAEIREDAERIGKIQ